MGNGWKVTAIIFIILFIAETLLVLWAFSLGVAMVEEENQAIIRENVCIINTCADYDSYYYDDITQVCECYTDNELQTQEVIE